MKFAVVAVLLALALGANSSVVPVVVGGAVPGTVVVGPSGAVVAAPGSVAVHAAAVPVGSVVVGPGPVQVVTGPVPAVVAPVVVGGGTYVAKTRGAVHVAPLPGHAQSAVSANLEPAPGTL